MAEPVPRKVMRWMIDHFLWDVTDAPREGVWGWLCAKWRLVVAMVGAILLTWGEWVKNHPPEIALIGLIHFVFVLVVIALVLHIVRWFTRSAKKLHS
jgi:hypothetical protein